MDAATANSEIISRDAELAAHLSNPKFLRSRDDNGKFAKRSSSRTTSASDEKYSSTDGEGDDEGDARPLATNARDHWPGGMQSLEPPQLLQVDPEATATTTTATTMATTTF